MKKIQITLILFMLSLLTVNAQDWLTDFDQAKKIAEDKGLPIVLVFQGSDWCAPCIKLDREVWSTDAFKDYAKKHFVMLKADFPRKPKNALPKEQEEHNKQLAEQYNRNGYFPFVVLLNEEGKVLGETGYKHLGPEEYIVHLKKLIK
ncbi:thioredoxin family protein [Echinicola sp. CAU 1574]|uniref:Thioredoxin family protein n=1 Tax=Echinicola arenosa TaxID=2774144 RepID=A0ABR9AMN8_9BACT|nr:thioredoxin family protein [Echinicola arenosa]MBD8489123.1 thioredoxin family protein [Echinicola arenosa]